VPQPTSDVAEVPALARAPGVEVLGSMAGSGYRHPPVLVRRADGQMLQLTPLLGAVLGALDGSRDLGAVARRVAEEQGRDLHPDDVRFLVDARLRPLGLIADAEPAELRRADPLLGLRGRVQLVGPGRTHALTRPFLWLFRPAIVIGVLAAFVATATWVLAHRGLGPAIDEAIADPLLLLGVVGLVLASGAFHELGHATACRYGGARPGGMGAAVYLVWPAFYTDVTDSYRLDRRGRLRVDLGGLYFNAVFTVLTAAAWWATGIEALLVLVPVQLLQMARQLIPLVRFDGYHVLADLVGVPDLFARIRPTLRRALPGGRGTSEANPLTTRAQVVVVSWVAVAVPALLASLGMLLWHLPAIMTSAVRSLRAQHALFVENVTSGQVAAAALGVVAMFTVAFLPVSAAYLLARFARRSGVRWWRITDGRPVLRAAPIGALVVALVLAGPGMLPAPPEGGGADLAGSVLDPEISELAMGAPAPQELRRPKSQREPGLVRPAAPAIAADPPRRRRPARRSASPRRRPTPRRWRHARPRCAPPGRSRSPHPEPRAWATTRPSPWAPSTAAGPPRGRPRWSGSRTSPCGTATRPGRWPSASTARPSPSPSRSWLRPATCRSRCPRTWRSR
jgi:putative peptide zinc metalloprotease protein